MALLDFQPVLGRHNLRPPHFASKVSYSVAPLSTLPTKFVVTLSLIKKRTNLLSEVGPLLCQLLSGRLVLHRDQEIVFLSALHNEEFSADEVFGRQLLVEGSEFFFVDADTAALR